jgi:hypothetical protein
LYDPCTVCPSDTPIGAHASGGGGGGVVTVTATLAAIDVSAIDRAVMVALPAATPSTRPAVTAAIAAFDVLHVTPRLPVKPESAVTVALTCLELPTFIEMLFASRTTVRTCGVGGVGPVPGLPVDVGLSPPLHAADNTAAARQPKIQRDVRIVLRV